MRDRSNPLRDLRSQLARCRRYYEELFPPGEIEPVRFQCELDDRELAEAVGLVVWTHRSDARQIRQMADDNLVSN